MLKPVFWQRSTRKVAIPVEIQIHHVGNKDGKPMFEVIRSMDMKRTEAAPLP